MVGGKKLEKEVCVFVCVCVKELEKGREREWVKVCAYISPGLFFKLFFICKMQYKKFNETKNVKVKDTPQEDILCFFISPYPSICIQRKCLIFGGDVYCQFIVMQVKLMSSLFVCLIHTSYISHVLRVFYTQS